jgi:hypothetical protein
MMPAGSPPPNFMVILGERATKRIHDEYDPNRPQEPERERPQNVLVRFWHRLWHRQQTATPSSSL